MTTKEERRAARARKFLENQALTVFPNTAEKMRAVADVLDRLEEVPFPKAERDALSSLRRLIEELVTVAGAEVEVAAWKRFEEKLGGLDYHLRKLGEALSVPLGLKGGP